MRGPAGSARRRVSQIAVVLALFGAAACSRPLRTARLSSAAPPMPAETLAEKAMAERSCSPLLGLLFPGLGHLCLGKTGEGAALASVAAAEGGASIAIALTYDDDPADPNDDDPPVTAPLTALQDVWVYGIVSPLFTRDLANHRRFVPQDTTLDLVVAPFNLEVLKRPSVWAGILGSLAVGLGVTLAVDGADTSKLGDDPVLFGHRVDRRWGYAAGAGLTVGLFSHVAIAEEALFRGWLQSSMARSHGETAGWVMASLAFGAVHLGNLAALERDQWADYLTYAMPVVTAAGFYLGWTYRHERYSLAPSVAVHFWYDTLLSAVTFALEPDDSVFAARVTLPL